MRRFCWGELTLAVEIAALREEIPGHLKLAGGHRAVQRRFATAKTATAGALLVAALAPVRGRIFGVHTAPILLQPAPNTLQIPRRSRLPDRGSRLVGRRRPCCAWWTGGPPPPQPGQQPQLGEIHHRLPLPLVTLIRVRGRRCRLPQPRQDILRERLHVAAAQHAVERQPGRNLPDLRALPQQRQLPPPPVQRRGELLDLGAQGFVLRAEGTQRRVLHRHWAS